MKFVHYQDCISPHQMPLARKLAKRVGGDNFHYLYLDKVQSDRVKLGWKMDGGEPWLCHIGSEPERAERALEECDAILIGYRDIDLIERMVKAGKRVFVQGERWFKPIHGISGKLRMLHPRFHRMCKRFVELVKNSDGRFTVLPIGIHALNDMKWLGIEDRNMALWGYYVESHDENARAEGLDAYITKGVLPDGFPAIKLPLYGGRCPINGALRIIYVGRLLKLKRVDTIIRAVRDIVNESVVYGRDPNCRALNVHLLIVGDGPEKESLEKLAEGLPVSFMPSVRIYQVRPLMRLNEVLVFSSDGRDGWGAVVSEALEEGLSVIGTYETGASATMLPKENLFHVGDHQALARILEGGYKHSTIGEWTAAAGAERLLTMA